MDGIHATRLSEGADLVQLWVATTSDCCGVAWAPTLGQFRSTLGFSIKKYDCPAATTAHELGHNLSLNHDRFVVNLDLNERGAYGEGYGYIDPLNGIRSIMAYSNQCDETSGLSCPRVQFFSNPRVYNNRVPFGLKKYINATARMNDTYTKVSRYVAKQSAHDPDIDKKDCKIPRPKGDDKDIHCFIATASYGSYMHPHVVTLRQFRDQFLKSTSWGREFIDFYYQHSPQIAQKIKQSTSLKVIVRAALYPIALAIEHVWVFLSILVGLAFLGLRRFLL